MKNLNIKWVPETFAIISLTIAATPQHPPTAGRDSRPEGCSTVSAAAGTKFIVISGNEELKADVRTTMA